MGLVEHDKEIFNIFDEACSIYEYDANWAYVTFSHSLLFLLILSTRVKYGLNLKNIFVSIFLTMLKIEFYKQ